MALRRDRRGMAVLVDALIFMVVLTLLIAVVYSASPKKISEDRTEMLRSYHSVMLAGELPAGDGSSMSIVTLAEYLIALSMTGAPEEGQVLLIEKMVNGTIAELETTSGDTWLVIDLGSVVLHFGSHPSDGVGDVYADRRELGDGSVISTLFLTV